MSHKQSVLALLCVLSVLWLGCATAPPQATGEKFRCGPGFRTYTVKVQQGSTGGGVRCVKFIDYQIIDGQIAGAYWYGEGTLNQYIYRHLGETWATTDPSGKTVVKSLASDIYGNGENAEFSASDLKLFPIQGQDHIQEVSEWPEQWIYEPSGAADYVSALNPVKECGRFFTKYGLENASGVRCSIRAEAEQELPYFVWYGDDGIEGRAARHLGIVTNRAAVPAPAVAVGLCQRGEFCPDDATLRLTRLTRCGEPFRIGVTGPKPQTWVSSQRRICP